MIIVVMIIVVSVRVTTYTRILDGDILKQTNPINFDDWYNIVFMPTSITYFK